MRVPLITALTALLLSACSTTTTPSATRPETILTVPVTAALSNQALEAQYGGQVALRTDAFAILANPTRQPLAAQGGTRHTAEKNRGVMTISPGPDASNKVWSSGMVGLWGSGMVGLWGSGMVGLWGSGMVGLWGSGMVGLWGSGVYQGMPQNTQTWTNVGLDYAYERSTLGYGKTIAVIDSGLDLNHAIFTSTLADQNTWKDFVDGDATPQDDGTEGHGAFGHGTAVASVAIQVSPRAKIMPLRVLDNEGSGDVLNVASAIVWAADHGADVINLSLGTGERVDAIQQALAYANKRGVLVAAAAGNSASSTPDYPAREFGDSKLNAAVGSVSSSNVISPFSSYGKAIGLMAPGEAIYAAYPGNRFISFSGTSISTPMVAGAMAIGLGEGKTPERALETLKKSALDIRELSGNADYKDKIGDGVLDLRRFVTKLQE